MLSSRHLVGFAAAGLLLTVVVAPASQGAAVMHREWRRYDASFTGPFLGIEQPTPVDTVAIGGVRLAPTHGDRSVFLALMEDQGRRVAGRFLFTDAQGVELGRGDFCREVTATIPAGAQVLWVFPSELLLPCPIGGSTGPAMSGVAYAEFRG